MTQRYRYELSAAADIAPAVLAVTAVGLCVGQTPTHALWAAVEAAEGRRLPPSEPAASFAEADNEAELLRIATLRALQLGLVFSLCDPLGFLGFSVRGVGRYRMFVPSLAGC